jgi:hypothetical protein
VIVVDSHTYHKEILKCYVQQVGLLPGTDAPTLTDELVESLGVTKAQVAISNIMFLHNIWADIMGQLGNDDVDTRNLYAMAKVVICWLLLENPRHTLEVLASSLTILEAAEGSGTSTEASETIHILVSLVLGMLITNSSTARIIADIDEHRGAIVGTGTGRVVDSTIIRYALGGLSDQLLSLLPM